MSDMGVVQENGEILRTTYFVSLDTTSNHSGADLRVVRVWYNKDGKALKWLITEQRYDFHPGGDNWQHDDVPGALLAGEIETRSGLGNPPPDLPDPDELSVTTFLPIDEKGYEAARKWAEPQVTEIRKNNKRETKKPPGTPPKYNMANFNCASWALEFVKKAGGPDIFPKPTKEQIIHLPANVLAWIKRRNCKHQWIGKQVLVCDMNPYSKRATNYITLYQCKLCGMTKPGK